MPRHFALSVTYLVIAAGVPAADLPANLVTNPSLEEPVGPTGLPPGWGSFYSNPAGAYQALVVGGGRTGKKEFLIDNVAQPDEAQFGAMPANRVPLDPTKRYVARGWVKVAGGQRATADVKLHYYAEGGAYLGQTRVGFASPGSDEWQLVTVTDRAADFPQAKLDQKKGSGVFVSSRISYGFRLAPAPGNEALRPDLISIPHTATRTFPTLGDKRPGRASTDPAGSRRRGARRE